MPGPLDLVFAVLFLIAYPLWDYFVNWPKTQRLLASGRPDARISVYRGILAVEWSAAAIVAALWLAHHRAAPALGLGVPGGWRLAVGALVVVAVAALMLAQLRAVRALPAAKRARLGEKLDGVGAIVPRTQGERRWFVAVSVTAGVCEELLYRGFLVWALRPWLGAWGAAGASYASFVFAHAYQGRSQIRGAAGMGLVLALLALGCGSILPGVVLHALVDVLGGETGHALVRESATAELTA